MKIFGVFAKLFKEVDDENIGGGNNEPLVDDNGRLINEDGYLINEDGDLVDEDGKVIEDEDDDEDDEEEKVVVQDDETKQALEIFKALNNKETAPAMMAFLNAKLAQNGLAPVNKSDLKEIGLADILKEGFGEEYAFLTEKLTPALEKAINHAVEGKIGNQLKTLEDSNKNLRMEIAEAKISQALDPIIEDMGAEEFDKIAPQLATKMQRYPNTANLPMKVYVKEMIKLVEGDKTSPEKTEKARKAIREAKRNRATGAEPSKVRVGSKTPTYKESIQLAMQGKQVEED